MRGESCVSKRGEKGEEKWNTDRRVKKLDKDGQKRPWKSLRDSHFPTASTTTSLTIPITFLENPIRQRRFAPTTDRFHPDSDRDQIGMPIGFTGIPKRGHQAG